MAVEDDECAICFSCPMLKPVATKCQGGMCQSLFCAACIKAHMDHSHSCPLCRAKVDQPGQTDRKRDAFRNVEIMICRETGCVLKVFVSATMKTRSLTRVRPGTILDACRGEYGDHKSRQVHRPVLCSCALNSAVAGSYFWRFHGSELRPLLKYAKIRDGFSIEQLDLNTGDVLACFTSLRAVAHETCVGCGHEATCIWAPNTV